ncbi:hypothetical protein [Lysobacter enzymogenes]|uniref:hypothetical protein n=1 Tax=Lysobacter enzymogenes TaxID=69 RepID=UPI00226526F0|nr:hypothetical protein [Lysobacter enzymogenes]UZW61205.1 hypothetical protein BV903_002595 [Lysobacter enzymogenes]
MNATLAAVRAIADTRAGTGAQGAAPPARGKYRMFANIRTGGRTAPRRIAAQRGQGQIWLVWGLIGAIAVFVALIGIGVYVGAKRHQETQQELRALGDTGNQLIEQQRRLAEGKAPDAALAPAAPAGETVPARNEAEMLRGFNALLREIGGRSQQQQARIARELEALQLEQVLTPERLIRAEGRRTSREALRRYRELIDRSAASSLQARTELRQRLEILTSRLTARDRLRAQFDGASAKRVELEQQSIRNQRNVADLTLRTVELIERAGSRVQLQQGQLAFSSQRDLDAFNGYVGQIQAAVAEEQRLARREQELLRQAQDQFNQVARP